MPHRVGFDPQGKGFLGKKKIYTHLVKHCTTPRHTVERNLDVLRRIGIFPMVEERELTLFVPEEARKKICSFGLEEGNYIVIHPVSRWGFKSWTARHVAQLIGQLHLLGYGLVLSSGPDLKEKEMIEEILRKVSHVPVLDLSGKITLKELAALIEMSQCLISVDSVPLHIASALKKPVVAIFGPSSDINWGPWMHPDARVVAMSISCRPCHLDGCGGSKMSDCLHQLPAATVLEAVTDLSKLKKETICQ